MARIKSAWEIALEKTQDIVIDEAKLLKDSLEKEGRALAGSYLNNVEMSVEELATKFATYSPENQAQVKSGMIFTVFANIGLPSDDLYAMRFERTCDLVGLISGNNAQAMEMMSQIGGFLKQYMDCKKDFISRMEDQIRQAMESSPETMNRAQYSKMIDQNLKKMDSQYSQALENTKEALRSLLEAC